MLFTSYEFIAFLAVFFLLYYIVPKKCQYLLVLLFSYIFYCIANPVFLIYILVTTISVYLIALLVQKNFDAQDLYLKEKKEELTKEEKKKYKSIQKSRRALLVDLVLVINVGILALVKYSDFLFKGINLSFMGLVIPMGISYYTIQAIGYVLDVKRGMVKAEKNFFKVALFVSFFPQLVQGPISRYADLTETLYGEHKFDYKQFSFGLQRILWGFFKKLVIADRLLPAIITITGDIDKYNGAYALLAMFLYTADLYADFTGGIDITIGIAQSIGVSVKENFIRPYFSKSLKEYWRRWHITMGTWFRDYIFYPVSMSKPLIKFSKFLKKHCGDRIGKRAPVYISSFAVWFVTGIWHGANWTFIVWGLLNWFILMVSEELEPLYDKFQNKTHLDRKTWYRGFQALRTFFMVTCLKLFDCYSSVGDTFRAFASMLTVKNYNIFFDGTVFTLGLSAKDFIVVALAILVVFTVSMIQRSGSVREKISKKPFAFRATVWAALIIVTVVFGAYGIGYDSSQFIYNRF